jgi:hypothetical protein
MMNFQYLTHQDLDEVIFVHKGSGNIFNVPCFPKKVFNVAPYSLLETLPSQRFILLIVIHILYMQVFGMELMPLLQETIVLEK